MNETHIAPGSNSRTVQRLLVGVAALPLTVCALWALLHQLRAGFDELEASVGSGVAAPAFICWWFVLRGHIAESRVRLRSAMVGGLILGGIAYAIGSFPEGLFGLLGIFVTGPAGFAAGVAFGAVYARLRVKIGEHRFRWPAITAVLLLTWCAAVVAFVYHRSQPLDQWVGELADGTVVKCTAPAEYADEVLTRWGREVARNPGMHVASSWREDVVRALKVSDGYVATFTIRRKRDLYIGRKHSNRGSTYACPWLEKNETVYYFVGRGLCPMGGKGKRSVYFADWPAIPGEDRYPPDDVAMLFWIKTLRPVPPKYVVWALLGK